MLAYALGLKLFIWLDLVAPFLAVLGKKTPGTRILKVVKRYTKHKTQSKPSQHREKIAYPTQPLIKIDIAEQICFVNRATMAVHQFFTGHK